MHCDVFYAFADLNDVADKVAEFRRKYAQDRKADEETDTSTGNTEILYATDDAPLSPATDDYP